MNLKYYLKYWTTLRKESIVTDKQSSIFEIDWDNLQKKQIKLLIFDIDDTLCPHEGVISKKVVDYLKSLQKKGFQIILYSNSQNERTQIVNVAKELSIKISLNSDKPSPLVLENLLSNSSVKKCDVAIVGDKVSTDLFSGYLVGINTRILVRPFSEIYGGAKAGEIYRLLRKIDNWFAKCR